MDIFADTGRISMQEAQKINAWYYLQNGVYLQLSEATYMALKLCGGVEKKIRSLLINYLDPASAVAVSSFEVLPKGTAFPRRISLLEDQRFSRRIALSG